MELRKSSNSAIGCKENSRRSTPNMNNYYGCKWSSSICAIDCGFALPKLNRLEVTELDSV